MSQHVGRDSAEPPVVTVRLAPLGRQGDYALGSRDLDVSPGSVVVVEGLKGVALGTVVSPPRAPVKLSGGVRRVVRLASTEDLEAQRKAEALEPEQARLVLRWLRDNEPTWKLLRIAPDGVARKVTICFGAAERAEARGPAREIGRLLGMRVELRQLGLRDTARVTGGVGRCGRELCCSTWLREAPTISVRMARDQNLPISPEKLNGSCGKSRCCLAYEHDLYKERRKWLPKLGKQAECLDGTRGKVVGLDVMRQTFTLREPDGSQQTLPAESWERNKGKKVPEPLVTASGSSAESGPGQADVVPMPRARRPRDD